MYSCVCACRGPEAVPSIQARWQPVCIEVVLPLGASCETFRQQFRAFLHSFDLPTAICDDDAQWHEFLKHYSGVIEDGSLECQGQGLKFVHKIIFRRGRARPSESYIPFDLVWEIALLNGKSLRVEVNAAPLPNGEPRIGLVATLTYAGKSFRWPLVCCSLLLCKPPPPLSHPMAMEVCDDCLAFGFQTR